MAIRQGVNCKYVKKVFGLIHNGFHQNGPETIPAHGACEIFHNILACPFPQPYAQSGL
jgi:hypothetical protein